MRHFLEGRGVNGVIHILDSLLNLEFLGVQLVFELINGGFKFADLNTDAKLDAHIMGGLINYHLLSVLSAGLSILEFLLE